MSKQRSSIVRRDETLHVKNEFLTFIQIGQKDLEVRLSSPWIKELYCGQTIRLASRSNSVEVKITAIRQYASFEKMLKAEDPNRIMPGMSSQEILSGLNAIYGSKTLTRGVYVLEFKIAC